MKTPLWLWILLFVLAGFTVATYGRRTAAEALALARADSLAWAQERHDELEGERNDARAALALEVSRNDWTRDSLAGVAAEAESRSQVNLDALAAVLADTAAVPVPDAVRLVVRRAITGLQNEQDVCQLRLMTCEATRVLLGARIRVDSISLIEKDSLLVQYRFQLDDAIAHRRRPAGVLRWVERGLVVYAIVRLGTELLGGR